MAESAVYVGSVRTRWGGFWGDHQRALRVLAVVTLVAGPVYFVWRVGWTLGGADPFLGAVLLCCELFGFWSLSALAFLSWSVPASVRPFPTLGHDVDVYVCTYNESEEVLRATLSGCRAMHYPHHTYLLDDGRRPGMERLAAQFGAVWLTRADNSHAKAGNVNHALGVTSGELVLILDADHVPMPDALDALVGYFDDPRLAVVQTPHDFYNHDSAQHYEVGRHEQSVFFEVICPGKNRHGASYWCGSAALIRREALIDVGGVATETIAEDFHTTIKMHRRGWTSKYHAETIVQGLAPHNLAAYLLQRDRWARGNLAVFTTPESPLRTRELPAGMRHSYLASLVAYAAGPIRLLTLALVAAVLWSGRLPMRPTPVGLLALWLPFTCLSLMAGSALCRGHMKIKDAFHFEVLTGQIHFRALSCVVRPSRMKFKVTPKEGIDVGGLAPLRQIPVATAITVVLCAGLVFRVVELIGGWAILPTLPGIARWAVPIIAAVEARRLLRTMRHVVARNQRRLHYRFPCELPATAETETGAMAVTITDISPRGARLVVDRALQRGSTLWLNVGLADAEGRTHSQTLLTTVTAMFIIGSQRVVGVRFDGLDEDALQSVIEYCYLVHTFERLRGVTITPSTAAALQYTSAVPETNSGTTPRSTLAIDPVGH